MSKEIQNITDNTPAKQLFTKVRKEEIALKLPIFFQASVLDKYSGKDDFKIIRTDTSGRITKKGSWKADFGISLDDSLIQISAEAFIYQIHKVELDHWLDHLVTLPLSENYTLGLVRPGCLDDGPIRKWNED